MLPTGGGGQLPRVSGLIFFVIILIYLKFFSNKVYKFIYIYINMFLHIHSHFKFFLEPKLVPVRLLNLL